MMNSDSDGFMCTSTHSFKKICTHALGKGLLVGAIGLLLSACSSIPDEKISESHPSDWDINPVAVDDFLATGSEARDEIDSDAIFIGDIADDMVMAKESEPVTVAAVKKKPVKAKKRRPTRSTPKKKAIEIVAPACAEPFSGQDETIVLATTDSLKLRRGPSTSAQTLAIIAPGKTVTARKLTCGNWTEIVEGKRPIGYVHSYFLSTP